MTVLVVVVAGVIAFVLVIKVMWGRRRRVTNNDVQEIEMGAVGGVPAPQPAVVAAPPIVDAGAGASGGAIPRRIPTTFRPTLNSRFGRKKVEVAQGKKITSSCCCCHVSN